MKALKKRRTIAEWLAKRYPDYDKSKYMVLVNDIPVDSSKLNSPIAPLDSIIVRHK